MHFIKEIILLGQKISEETHEKFTRYGRGEFDGPSISIKKLGNLLKINGSIDYINIIGEIILKNSKQSHFSISGKIFSKDDRISSELEKGEIKILKYGKKLGTSAFDLNGTYPSEKILKIYENFGNKAHILLNLKSKDRKWSLKSKKNLPKLGSNNENFFSATLGIEALPYIDNEILFDDVGKKVFNDEIKISHKYLIQELLIPDEYENNFKEARVHAKRKGIIRRFIEIDRVKKEKEINFEV